MHQYDGQGYLLASQSAAEPVATSGGRCPSTVPVKKYDISAINVEISLNQWLDFYPGYMYVLTENLEKVRAEEAKNKAGRENEKDQFDTGAVTNGIQGDYIQPLVIRGNQGDCVKIVLRNALEGGEAVSLHIHGSSMIMSGTGKPATTTNPDAIVAKGKSADMECDDNGFHMHDRHGYRDRDFDDVSIDIEVKLPKGMIVDAHSVSGDVSVVGAEGRVRAGSVSGDVRMERLRASSVNASSVSGNVTVGVESLTGEGPLRFTSVSGNVTAELPKGIDADVTMRTVSGALDSDFPLTLNGRVSRSSLEARIGKGGRDLEVRTVSGDVRLRAAK